MMLYVYAKSPEGNVIRIGEDCDVPQALQAKLSLYSEKGYVAAEAYEHDEQVIGAATRGTPAPEAQEVEEAASEAPAEVEEGAPEAPAAE